MTMPVLQKIISLIIQVVSGVKVASYVKGLAGFHILCQCFPGRHFDIRRVGLLSVHTSANRSVGDGNSAAMLLRISVRKEKELKILYDHYQRNPDRP
jgi:hypothetical protein